MKEMAHATSTHPIFLVNIDHNMIRSLQLSSLALILHCASLLPITANAQEVTADERGYIVRVGDTVPPFKLTDTSGNEFTRESLLGSTYILQFTASWCGVCRKEMPHLEAEVWGVFRDKNFVLLGVDLDEPMEKVIQFAHQMGISYPIAPDPQGELFYSIAGPKSGVTRNVVVNSEGEIVLLTRLFDEDEFASMIQVVKDLLDP
jgi:peroxiredoxin